MIGLCRSHLTFARAPRLSSMTLALARCARLVLLLVGGLVSCAVIVAGALVALAMALGTATLAGLRAIPSEADASRNARGAWRERHDSHAAFGTYPADPVALLAAVSGGGHRGP